MRKKNPSSLPEPSPHGQILLYKTGDGRTRLECRFEDETIWLAQAQMAELFQTTKQNISLHLKNVFSEGELFPEATVKEYLTVQLEGQKSVTRKIDHYNLDAILAVGYRVKSHRGTQFRIWATSTLREFLVKGFTLDDERLKRAGGDGYFEELLARIRDIRSSERVFWKKVLDIYATSIDYDAKAESSQLFFKTVQNKMHWAAHGQTAAEVIAQRADAGKLNMGLTSWIGDSPKRTDVSIAKNYLNAEELELLNRIVTAYLEFAELQARARRPMHMKDWVAKLDDFLKLSGQEVLTHPGRITHEVALTKAEAQFDMFQSRQADTPNRVERDFQEAVSQIKKLEKARPQSPQSRHSPKEPG
jgi:hypothetical protein